MLGQRFKLLPQPIAAAEETELRGETVDTTGDAPVEVISIARLAQGGRWRTEAMRSYARPVLIWFTRGQGRVTISGRTGGYGPHNLIFLPPRTMHGFTTLGPVLGSVVFLPDAPGFEWPAAALHLRLHEAQLQRELTAIIDAMDRETSVADERTARALASHAGLLSVWLGRTAGHFAQTAQPGQGARADSKAHRLTEAFTSLVERDFRDPAGVQHYAALLGVTPTHLTRVCRKVSGRAALDILTDRRHFEARRLLRDTDMQISEIARKSGFASAAYFTRAFRTRTGQSPSEFRNTR